MLACVACISLSNLGGGKINMDAVLALCFGIFAPFMIAITISVSKYWTMNYGYNSKDFTIDTFLCMGLLEVGLCIKFEASDPVGYDFKQISFGIIAAIFQILGTLLMFYSATYGLAGPASAMVQSQCIIQTILAAVFLGAIPNTLDVIGMCFAITGAVVMSVDFDFSRFKKGETR